MITDKRPHLYQKSPTSVRCQTKKSSQASVSTSRGLLLPASLTSSAFLVTMRSSSTYVLRSALSVPGGARPGPGGRTLNTGPANQDARRGVLLGAAILDPEKARGSASEQHTFFLVRHINGCLLRSTEYLLLLCVYIYFGRGTEGWLCRECVGCDVIVGSCLSPEPWANFSQCLSGQSVSGSCSTRRRMYVPHVIYKTSYCILRRFVVRS